MKSKLALLPLVLLSVSALAQSVGGCISHFAENYDPNATFNDGSCNYDLQQLLNDGFELGDLLSSGVEVDELIGLFGAGGFIVDIDLNNGRTLVAWPFGSGRMYDNRDDLTYGLLSDMFRDREFGSGIYDGYDNWEKILKKLQLPVPWILLEPHCNTRNEHVENRRLLQLVRAHRIRSAALQRRMQNEIR